MILNPAYDYGESHTMARVRDGQRSLADLIDLTNLDRAVKRLLRMSEEEFAHAVLLYIEGDLLGMDAMRDPDVIERTSEMVERLLRQQRRRWKSGDRSPDLARTIETLDHERKTIRGEARVEREARIRLQEGEHRAEYEERVASRLERAVTRQRAAREELDQVQRKGIDARALEELKRRNLPQFLAIKREIKRKDDEGGEQARENGAGAADPPKGSTAPAVPTQAVRV